VSGDDDDSWHDQQPLILAAGGAGLLLLVLLVWAVIDTSANSRVPDTAPFAPSSANVVDIHDEVDIEHELPRYRGLQTSQDNPVVTGPAESTTNRR